jgi:3-methyladenine DNA glycosylase AlkD
MKHSEEIYHLLSRYRNGEDAFFMKKYMKNKFDFFGIKTIQRRLLVKTYFQKKEYPNLKEILKFVKECYHYSEREMHLIAIEVAAKVLKQQKHVDSDLMKWMITNQSWWDSVDGISTEIVAVAVKNMRKNEEESLVNDYLNSNNMWLQRTAIIYQRKFRLHTDVAILSKSIKHCLGSKEFFINKGIGWALREYAKHNPTWVKEFVKNNENLAPLSRREALRNILKNS